MSRNARQSKILNIIATQDIETQEELVAALTKAGFSATQATVSRDIKELNLVKTQEGDKYKYATIAAADGKVSSKLLNLFKETVISVTPANNLVVVRTLANSANAVCAVVEQLKPDILGAVASGDTLLIVTTDSRTAVAVGEELAKLQY